MDNHHLEKGATELEEVASTERQDFGLRVLPFRPKCWRSTRLRIAHFHSAGRKLGTHSFELAEKDESGSQIWSLVQQRVKTTMAQPATNGVEHIDADDQSKTTVPLVDAQAAILDSFHLENVSPATLAVHADDPLNVVSDVAPPVHVSTTFRYPRDPEQLHSIYGRPSDERDPTEHCYSRDTTHGSSRLEAILTSLLRAPCLTYSSGLSAFHALLVFLNPKVIAIGDGYHGCHGVIRLQQRLTGCKRLPLDCKPEDLSEGDLVCVETPINPTGKAFNIQHYADIAHSRGHI